MTQSHYSLRWNNHQNHILSAFEALLQAETLVDVTLVCAETSVRAHKVVLSACSPFFQRIFSDNPCKHPVIVLKDFGGWEVQAIIDFMYKGEISVIQEQLQSLIKAAESLQVRGLANQDTFDKDTSVNGQHRTPTPATSPADYYGRYPTSGVTVRTPAESASPYSPASGANFEPAVKLPHMSRLSFPESLLPRQECQSPLPRRKQARPRRRSGEMCTAQDLSTPRQPLPPPSAPQQQRATTPPTSTPPAEDIAENLCMKRPKDERRDEDIGRKTSTTTPDPIGSPEMDLSVNSGNAKEYRTSPPMMLPSALSMKQEIENHSPLPFPPMPSVSALAMTPPHSKYFGLDSPLGLFPPGLDSCRNPLFDMADPRTTPDPQLFVKKKMGRPKGQHSAPRGGPPRSWTNAELTEALQHVWNKKMTTSQASRIFGIPYNSLLMYVRGKYGKSLKLEQLRKDCIGGPTPPLDLLGLGGNNNNNAPCKPDDTNRPASAEEAPQPPPPPPVFNPFAHSFYPDFGTGFPIPVGMIHLLPQSEKSREHYGALSAGGGGVGPAGADDELVKKEQDESEEVTPYRTPTLSVDDRRELVQQNGQD